MAKVKDRPHFILGQNVAKRRDELGLDQPQLAEKVGMGVSGLRDIERGVAEGNFRNREALTQIFDCSMADLYTDPAAPPKGPDFAASADVLAKFADLPPARRNFVLALIYRDESYSERR